MFSLDILCSKDINMSRNLILINSSHYKGQNNFEYILPKPVDFSGFRLQLVSFSMYNSTFNISQALGNHKFSIKWVNNVTYNYTIPDGYYDFDALNLFFEFCMLGDNLYCKTTTAPVFFINVSANDVQYNAQINVNYVPASAEGSSLGYTIPNNAWTFPGSKITPQLIMSTGLQSIFGFQGGQSTFPVTPGNDNAQFTSTSLAVLSPTYCIVLTANLLNSDFSNVPTLLGQVPIDVSFGSLIKYEASANNSVPISNSKFGSIKISLWNQDMLPLQFKDHECTITLAIEEDSESNLCNAINKLVKAISP
jgi:hypothetical protein